MTEQQRRPGGRTSVLVVATVVCVGGSLLAFQRLDPIIAAFVAIVAGTVLVIAFLARDWDRHSTYEEREAARARRRQEKWERGAAARARDRARWEAHQARRSEKAAGPDAGRGDR